MKTKAARNIRLFYLYNFLLDFRPYAALGIVYFARESGSYAAGMAVFGIATISSAVLEIPLGLVSDTMGRKLTLVLGTLFGVLSLAGFAFGGEYWVFALAAALGGAAGAMFSGNNNALLHESLEVLDREKDFHEYLGKTSSMFQFALATSAVLGGIIGARSLRLMMAVSIIPQILALVISVFFSDMGAFIRTTEETDAPATERKPFGELTRAFRLFIRNPSLRRISLAKAWGNAFGEGAYQFQAAFIAQVLPIWAIGFVKTLGNLTAALSFRYSGAVIRRFGPLACALFGRIYGRVLVIASLIWVTKLSPFIMSLGGLMFGVQSVAEETLMQKEFSSSLRATMGSIASLLGSLLFAAASILIGLIADHFSVRVSFLIVQFLMVPAILIIAYHHRTLSAQREPTGNSRSLS